MAPRARTRTSRAAEVKKKKKKKEKKAKKEDDDEEDDGPAPVMDGAPAFLKDSTYVGSILYETSFFHRQIALLHVNLQGDSSRMHRSGWCTFHSSHPK